MTWSGQQLRATQNSPCFGLPLLHWSNGECLSRRTPSGLLAPSRISSGFSKLPSESACPRFRFTGTPGGSLPSSMLHRNTSHRDGAQGEGAEGPSTFSSPSASRSPSGSSRPARPMTPPSATAPREPPEPPPAKGFVVGFFMAVCCCCLADETIM
nr:uncharacterized protein LOC117846632 [Setaria viridis]